MPTAPARSGPSGSPERRRDAEEGADERRLAPDSGLLEHALEMRPRRVDTDPQPAGGIDEVVAGDDQPGETRLGRGDVVDGGCGREPLPVMVRSLIATRIWLLWAMTQQTLAGSPLPPASTIGRVP